MNDYVTKEEFKQRCDKVDEKLEDITDNHLTTIWGAIEFIFHDIRNIRWLIMGGVGVLAIVLAILEVFGGG